MSKVIGFVIGAIEIGIGIVTGNVALIVSGAAMIIASTANLLLAPKTPAREAQEMTLQLGEQPRCIIVGEAATAGSLVDGFNYGGSYGTDWEVLVIRLADERSAGLTGYYVNDAYVAHAGNGAVAGYNGQLEVYFRGDTTNDALPAILTAHGPGWTAADIGESGCDVVVAYKADDPEAKNPVWPGGRPHFLWVVKGGFRYDPRKDSTVAGGSGTHRWTNPATWEWSDNPIVCRYNWARGIFANGDVTDPSGLLVGRGLSAAEAPPENVFAGANLCDELVDGEKRYLVDGPIYGNQQYLEVEDMFAAATGGTIVTREGSVEVEPGHAQAPSFAFTDDDIVVGTSVEWNHAILSDGDDGWVNSVVANYVEPAQQWQPHDAPVRRDTADIVADGRPREATLTLRLVKRAAQAGRCAEIARRLGRLWGRGAVSLGPRFAEVEAGDWGTWTSQRRFGGATKSFRVEAYQIDEKWQNRLTLREIVSSAFSDGAFIPDQAVADQPDPPGAVGIPGAGAWTLAAELLTITGGSVPILSITGAVDDSRAQVVRFEYWLDDGVTALVDAPWITVGYGGPTTTSWQISSVAPGGNYYAAITYLVDGVPGDRRFEGPVTAGDIVSGTFVGAGDLALLDGVTFGTNIYRSTGGPAVVDADAITSLGTAAGIFGQGSLATASAAAWGSQVTGRPTELTDGRIAAGLDSAGDLSRNLTTGRLNGSNVLRWTGGALYVGELTADTTASHTASAITGQGSLATLSAAAWGSQVTGRPAELTDGRITAALDSSGDLARNITTTRRNASNLLGYTGGATFTGELSADVTSTHTASAITGQGSLATLSAAAWGSQVTGRPTELTDGRVSAALDSSGDLARNITTGRLNSSNVLRWTGGALYVGELSADVTGTHVASAITGQGALATLSSVGASQFSGTVGGGNLLRNSSFETDADANGMAAGFYPYTNDANLVTMSQVTGRLGGFAQRCAWAANTSTKGLYLANSEASNNENIWRANQAYVWSFYAKASGAAVGTTLQTNWNHPPASATWLANPALSANWQRYVVAINFGASTLDTNGFISVASTTANGASTLDIDDMQIEEGDVLTAYAPRTDEILPGTVTYGLLSNTAGRLGVNIVRNDGSTSFTDAIGVTSLGTAAAIAGQGALATASAAAWGSQVTGRPAELTDGRITAALDSSGDLARNITTTRRNASNLLGYTGGATFTGELAADVTSTHTASAITSQGALATQSQVNIGASGRVYRDDGSTRLTDALAVTSLGTAAAIAGQGSFATLSSISSGLADTNNLMRRTSGGLFTGDLGATLMDNFALNGYFTAGQTGFYLGPDASYVTLGAANDPGPHGIRFVANPAGGTDANSYAYVNNGNQSPYPHRKMWVAFALKCAVASAVYAFANCYDAGNNLLGVVSAPTTATAGTGAWEMFTLEMPTLPLGTALVNVYIQRNGTRTSAMTITAIRVSPTALGATVGSIFNSNTYRNDGVTLVTDSLAITALGTAAAISGQGSGATANNLTGLNATEGAKLGGVSDGAGTSGLWVSIGSYTFVVGNSAYKNGGTHGAFEGAAVGVPRTGGIIVQSSINYPVIGGSWETHLALDNDATSYAVASMNYRASILTTGSGNFNWTLYVANSAVASGSSGGLALSSRMALAYDNAYAYMIVDGVILGTSALQTPGQKLWPKLLDYYGNGSGAPITDLQQGPFHDIARSSLFGTNGVALNSNMLPANVLYGLIPSLKTAPTISDTDNSGTVTINIGSAVHVPDSGGTVTFPSGTIAGKAYGTTYYLKRVGVDPVSAPTGTGWNASTTLTINVGDVYENYYTTRASGGVPSPPPPPPPGGGGRCVAVDMWMELDGEQFRKAGEAAANWPLCILDYETLASSSVGRIAGVEFGYVQCVRLLTESGGAGIFSETTPLTLQDGSSLSILEGAGQMIFVRDRRSGQLVERWELIASVEPAGRLQVAQIHAGGVTFAAGESEDFMLMTHNYDKP